MKNAKKDLLRDEKVRQAFAEIERTEAARFAALPDGDPSFSPGFEKRMDALLSQKEKPRRAAPARRVIAAALAAALLLILVIPFAVGNRGDGVLGEKIEFPASGGDDGISYRTKVVYDLAELKKQTEVKEVFIYSDPRETDYSVAEKLGFDRNTFTERRTTRCYKEKNAMLFVDRFGCFDYSVESSVYKQYPYSDRESMEIARTFLKEHDLFPEDCTLWRISGQEYDYNSDGSARTLVGVTVSFLPAEVDGCAVSGAGIGVRINGKGEVVSVYYQNREYQKKEKAIMIPLEQAVRKCASAESANLSEDIDAEKIVIEKAELMYYAQNNNPEITTMQPVWLFSGTAYDKDGQTAEFRSTVQANRY